MTGAYHPEISAAAVQVKAAAAALRGRADVSVLTTAIDRGLPAVERVDDVAVYRVHIDPSSAISKAQAAVQLGRHLLRARQAFDLIHVHGYSQKNLPVMIGARVLRKPVVMTLHTAGQDEPNSIQRRGVLPYWAFRSPDLVLSVSPALAAAWNAAGLPADRVRISPNGIDTTRFRPASRDQRRALRTALGWPQDRPVVLFVGFFSRDKRPDLLFRAWRRLDAVTRPQLVFVGAKGTGYYEIEQQIAAAIQRDAVELGAADRVTFVEPTTDVERCFRAADLFVLPSVREAHPLALLEAMACGLPVIATRLSGATDTIVDDGRSGILVPPDDEQALAGALRAMLDNDAAARAIGQRARETVAARYDIGRTADAWLDAYRAVLIDQR